MSQLCQICRVMQLTNCKYMTTPTPDTRGIYQPSLSSFTIHNIHTIVFYWDIWGNTSSGQYNTWNGPIETWNETHQNEFLSHHIGQETTFSMFSPQFEAGSGVIGLYNFYINFVWGLRIEMGNWGVLIFQFLPGDEWGATVCMQKPSRGPRLDN